MQTLTAGSWPAALPHAPRANERVCSLPLLRLPTRLLCLSGFQASWGWRGRGVQGDRALLLTCQSQQEATGWWGTAPWPLVLVRVPTGVRPVLVRASPATGFWFRDVEVGRDLSVARNPTRWRPGEKEGWSHQSLLFPAPVSASVSALSLPPRRPALAKPAHSSLPTAHCLGPLQEGPCWS